MHCARRTAIALVEDPDPSFRGMSFAVRDRFCLRPPSHVLAKTGKRDDLENGFGCISLSLVDVAAAAVLEAAAMRSNVVETSHILDGTLGGWPTDALKTTDASRFAAFLTSKLG